MNALFSKTIKTGLKTTLIPLLAGVIYLLFPSITNDALTKLFLIAAYPLSALIITSTISHLEPTLSKIIFVTTLTFILWFALGAILRFAYETLKRKRPLILEAVNGSPSLIKRY